MARMVGACVLFLAACLAAAAEEGRDAAFNTALNEVQAELDETFIVERTGVFVVAGDLARREFAAFKTSTIENCSAALWKDFFKKRPTAPIKIYLFRDKPSYEKWVRKLAGFAPRTPFGFYMRARSSMMMNISTGGGTLVHELTHALMEADFPGCPTWLFEGLGSLFEQCQVTRDGHIQGLVNWRLPILQNGGFVPLRTLVEMSDEQFRGEKESLNYANARYLCLYLQKQGLLTKFYAAFRDAHLAGTDKTGWDTLVKLVGRPPDQFEKEWQEWATRLRWPE